jgi:ubiquinone/menaquinone biosynthesis C-methylase UbiE
MRGDVPSPIDLRQMPDAAEWEQSAMSKRPWRAEFFARFASEIAGVPGNVRRVLELGSGPGFLARHLLETSIDISSYTLLDFSPAMHQLAKVRLAGFEDRVRYIESDFKQESWPEGLGNFDCVVINQAVHELRQKRYATKLHSQVRRILENHGLYLVCDHFAGIDGQENSQLYMSIEEQRDSLLVAGFARVEEVHVKGGLVLHKAT